MTKKSVYFDSTVIACVTVKDANPANIVSDASIRSCDICDEDVWLSKASIDNIESHGIQEYTICCIQCATNKAKNSQEDITIMPVSKEQWHLIKEHYDKEKRDADN